MNRKKKFVLRLLGLWLVVVVMDVFFNLLLTPTDPINECLKESLTLGFLGGTMFALIADRIDVHYREKEA